MTSWREPHNRRAQSASVRRGIGPICNKRCASEDSANNLALHANAFAMNDSHGAKACLMGLMQVFLDHALHITWWNRVQVDNVGNLDLDRLGKRIESINFVLVACLSRVRVVACGACPIAPHSLEPFANRHRTFSVDAVAALCWLACRRPLVFVKTIVGELVRPVAGQDRRAVAIHVHE